ncbi:MAG: ATP-binding protein [Armatimonadota bacterium]
MRSFAEKTWRRLNSMAVLHWSSLRGKLLYTLVGLLLVLLTLESQEYFHRVHHRRQVLIGRQLRAARAEAGMLRAALDQIHRSQEVIGESVLGRWVPDAQANGYLRVVKEQYEGLVGLQVIGTDWTVQYGAPDTNVRKQIQVPGLTPQAPRQVSDVYRPIEGEPPRVWVATLVTRRARPGSSALPSGTPEVLGAVTMEFEASALASLLAKTGESEADLLLDQTGTPIAADHPLVARPELEAALKRALAVGQNRPFELMLNGAPMVGHAVPVPGTPWQLVSLQSEQELASLWPDDTRPKIILMLGVVIAFGAAIYLLLRLSMRPVVRLSAAARKLGSGDLSLRLPPAEVREFEPLVEAFNSMALRLASTHDQLVAANQALEERVRERTRELEWEHEKLLRAERLSTLGLLSSAIAHDLRNPLNTISLTLHWLRMRLNDQKDERLEARLEIMQRELKRSDQIIRTLLAFARTGEPQLQWCDLNDLVEEVADVVHPEDPVELRLRLDPHLPAVRLDRAQLFQVLENLVRNAVQAMPEGGQVRVSTSQSGDHCVIEVEDTGAGIPEELRDTIFEPLVTTKSTGTGLGLALCKRIVDAHGGQICADNAPEGGARFRIELPIHPAGDFPQPDSHLDGADHHAATRN